MGRAKKKLEKKKQAQTTSGKATVATNKKAGFDFHLDKEIVAGIVLTGTEVKSLRQGKVQLKGAYAKIIDGEVFLFNCHISEYEHGNRYNHEPLRAKKLLLKRYEIDKLEGELQRTNKTLVASKIFFKKNRAKVALHLAEGKKLYDKRADLKKKSQDRDIRRALSDLAK
jgi:SsrA-binding protein